MDLSTIPDLPDDAPRATLEQLLAGGRWTDRYPNTLQWETEREAAEVASLYPEAVVLDIGLTPTPVFAVGRLALNPFDNDRINVLFLCEDTFQR